MSDVARKSLSREQAGDVLDRAREAVIAALQHYCIVYNPSGRVEISEFEFTRIVVAHLHDYLAVADVEP